jgi:hypothetical protein
MAKPHWRRRSKHKQPGKAEASRARGGGVPPRGRTYPQTPSYHATQSGHNSRPPATPGVGRRPSPPLPSSHFLSISPSAATTEKPNPRLVRLIHFPTSPVTTVMSVMNLAAGFFISVARFGERLEWV